MSEDMLRGAIEAILMVTSEPITTSDLVEILNVDAADIEQHIRALATEYLGEGQKRPRGFELHEMAGGWHIYSVRAYVDVVGRFVVGSPYAHLSQAASEMLAVIAYRQPISKARICRVCGVNVDGVVRTLPAQGLMKEIGLTPSGARLYETTGEFLKKMGLTSLSGLISLAPYLPDADVLEELEEEL